MTEEMWGYAVVGWLQVNISDSALDMEQQFGWTPHEKGLVLSSFFFGYICGQIPGNGGSLHALCVSDTCECSSSRPHVLSPS